MQEALFTRDGQLRQRGRVFIHFGDWREAVATWPSKATLVTDPPYGNRYRSNYRRGHNGKRRFGVDRKLATRIVGDNTTRERDAVMRLRWSAAAVFGPARIDRTPPWQNPRQILAWDKGDGSGMGDLSFPWRPNYETIAIYGLGWTGKRSSSVLRGTVLAFSRESASNGRYHPHEKPLNVVAELVEKAPPGSIVDPFAGGGTTLLAAALLGRDAYGGEIDPQYRDVILGRLAADGIEVVIV